MTASIVTAVLIVALALIARALGRRRRRPRALAAARLAVWSAHGRHAAVERPAGRGEW